MKNRHCLFVKKMHALSSENRLLLTGTPLQNKLCELWSLLHFILPNVFDNLELFESWFALDEPDSEESTNSSLIDKTLSGKKKAKLVGTLHEILRPFVLRRLKIHVTKELPAKKEVIVYAALTEMQQEFCSLIGSKTFNARMQDKYPSINAGGTIRNRIMQLRKCCNHPFLLDPPELSTHVTLQHIVSSCGKVQLLHAMLPQLHAAGHRVLLFSQMTRVLDILEEYCELAGYDTARIDGNVSLTNRVAQMKAFQKPDGPFVFLLSTRAAGLGLNLVQADTVILYDSDWNPQQDNQAQDRAHRIGQTKPVAVYRLITENSVENRMLEKINAKRKLERLVIQRGNFKKAGESTLKALQAEELEDLLRDDVTIRSGEAKGGIQTDELAKIMDRDLLFSKILPMHGQGYEFVDTSLSTSLVGSL